MARTASAIGRQNRKRGADFERDVCRVVLEHTGVRLKRELRRTEDRGDLVEAGEERAGYPWRPECKSSTGNAFLAAWLDQAVASAQKAGLLPCVVYRIGGRPMRVRVPTYALALAHGGNPCDEILPLWWADVDVETWCWITTEIMAGRAMARAAA